MAESDVVPENDEVKALEDHVVKIIIRIKKNRSRPCYQNILTFLAREGRELNLDDIKVVLDRLISKRIIKNIGKVDHESFSLFQEKTNNSETIHIVDNFNEDISSFESYKDKSFYSALLSDVKLEVKNALDEAQISCITNAVNSDITSHVLNKSQQPYQKDYHDQLIDALNSEIHFLRKELLSKDTIIKLLISDKSIDLKTKELDNKTSIDIDKNVVNKNYDLNKSKTLVTDYNHRKKASTNNDTNKNVNDFKPQKKAKENLRTVSIVGDSMLKDVKGYQIKKNLPPNTKVYVRPNSGATTEDMHHYVEPTKKFNPDLYIVHSGTNDLRSGKEPSEIAKDIVQLALNLKVDENDVAISSIVHRNDDLNDKAIKVNDFLKIQARTYNLGFIEHNNITNIHLNNSRLHLTLSGANILSNNFINYIKL